MQLILFRKCRFHIGMAVQQAETGKLFRLSLYDTLLIMLCLGA